MAANPIPEVGRVEDLARQAQELLPTIRKMAQEREDYRIRWDDRRALEARLRELRHPEAATA